MKLISLPYLFTQNYVSPCPPSSFHKFPTYNFSFNAFANLREIIFFYTNILNIYFKKTDWYKDIRQLKYFLNSLLFTLSLSWWHLEITSDLLPKSSLWFGCKSIAKFLWRHNKYHFTMFVYGVAVWISCHTNVGVYFSFFFSVVLFRYLLYQNN